MMYTSVHCTNLYLFYIVSSIPVLQEYMLEDLRSNSEIAFAWLYQEYANLRGYIPQFSEEDISIDRYDNLLCAILDSLLSRSDQRDG